MQVKINPEKDHTYEFDAEHQTVLLVFKDDEEVRSHIRNLSNMVDKYPQPGMKRGYLVYPDGSLSLEQVLHIQNKHIALKQQ